METPDAVDPHGVVDPWAVLDTLPDALALIDAGGRVRFLNAAWRRLDLERAHGQALEIGDDFLSRYAAELATAPPGPSRWPGVLQAELRRKDGSTIAAELVIGALRDRRGAISHWSVTMRADPQRQREQERRQQRLRGESLGALAGGFAHDFNNLLAVILGSASLAMLDHAEPSPTREALVAIHESAKRGAALVAQMLAYAGKGRLQAEVVELNRLVGEASAAGLPPHISLTLQLDPQLSPVLADAGQIRRALQQLVRNAVEAIGEAPGAITIATAARWLDQDAAISLSGDLAPGMYVAIEVRDTGRGLDRAAIERVFEPFFSTKFTGRGLGLAEVFGIVSSHGGGMYVESAVGAGASFTILLPVSEAIERSAPAESRPGDQPPGGALVLVVDDEDGVRSMTARILRHAGYRVVLADGGASGVEAFLCHADEIACVLLDLVMPDLDGALALEAIRQRRPDTAVVLMSGYSERELAREFGGRGLAGLLQKPFTSEALIASVRQAGQHTP